MANSALNEVGDICPAECEARRRHLPQAQVLGSAGHEEMFYPF